MDFTTTEVQQDIASLSRQILSDQVTPESLHQYDSREVARCDANLWSQLAQGGMLGIAVSDKLGGMGFGFTELAIFFEECGRVLAPVPAIPACTVAITLEKFGDEADGAVVADIVAGDVIASAAIQEECNDDVYAPVCEVSDGKLHGIKHGVAYFEQAQVLLVVARENDELGLYSLDPRDSTVQGTPLWTTTMEPQSYVTFTGTPVKKIGGAEAVSYFIERYTAALCAYQVGACEEMLRLTSEYTSEREQFGVKIATFQAVGHRAANCYIDVACLRLVVQQAVSKLDAGEDADISVSVAKSWCGDASHRISTATQHLHGGMGVDRDYALWRYALWAKQNELQLGNTTYHLRHLGEAIAAGDFDIDQQDAVAG